MLTVVTWLCRRGKDSLHVGLWSGPSHTQPRCCLLLPSTAPRPPAALAAPPQAPAQQEAPWLLCAFLAWGSALPALSVISSLLPPLCWLSASQPLEPEGTLWAGLNGDWRRPDQYVQVLVRFPSTLPGVDTVTDSSLLGLYWLVNILPPRGM